MGGKLYMIIYKINILEALKKAGYSSYRLRQEKVLGEGTLQQLRIGNTKISVETLDTICTLLECQPGDLIEWMPGRDEKQHIRKYAIE